LTPSIMGSSMKFIKSELIDLISGLIKTSILTVPGVVLLVTLQRMRVSFTYYAGTYDVSSRRHLRCPDFCVSQ
jgi:hypothetical protein